MKNLDLNSFGAKELTRDEMKEISGGWFWVVLAIIAGLVAAAAAIIDYANGQSNSSSAAIDL